ncbi:MAG: hypothetical protein ACYS8W_20390 [Planctomycetota bacterium]
MRKRIIFLLISWGALLIPGIIASELAKSYANKFLNSIPDVEAVDKLAVKSKGKVDEAADKLGNAASKVGLGDAVDKLKGEAEEKAGETAKKVADTGAQKFSEHVLNVKGLCSLSFPGFQFKLLGLCPTLSIIFFAALGILSFGFMYCGRRHVEEEV